MKKNLKKTSVELYYHEYGIKKSGKNPRMSGNCSGLSGDCSDINGNFDDCEITNTDRDKIVDIKELIM